jgi:hypothetical protein
MIHPYPHLSISQPARYRILVQGWLGEGWDDWFEGMRLTSLELAEDLNGSRPGKRFPAEMTLLAGLVPDQAALLGMLQRLYSFGLPLLKVELVSQDEALSDSPT